MANYFPETIDDTSTSGITEANIFVAARIV
jgi:hypothetical protein